MCIAIVKAKGITIPEEHLKNGWTNNDDGAGFACVDENGNFLIHKSMTWEGFIGKYNEAVEKYGDTSDFLIHFRITSKGATTLENCHPFQVDGDRVIIHNGTMSNISIAKDDPRSDTKIFAEDFLPTLPENWEDNEVIKYFMESFIGYSKVCMLHRTKGIYIFNEGKGVFVGGHWYSNESYKTARVTYYNRNFGTNTTTNNTALDSKEYGFYSYKLKRWVEPEEAVHYTWLERKEHSDWGLYETTGTESATERYTWVRCAICNCLSEAAELRDCIVEGEHMSLCATCEAISESEADAEEEYCDYCNLPFDGEDIALYWSQAETEPIRLCYECRDLYTQVMGTPLMLILDSEADRSAAE